MRSPPTSHQTGEASSNRMTMARKVFPDANYSMSWVSLLFSFSELRTTRSLFCTLSQSPTSRRIPRYQHQAPVTGQPLMPSCLDALRHSHSVFHESKRHTTPATTDSIFLRCGTRRPLNKTVIRRDLQIRWTPTPYSVYSSEFRPGSAAIANNLTPSAPRQTKSTLGAFSG